MPVWIDAFCQVLRTFGIILADENFPRRVFGTILLVFTKADYLLAFLVALKVDGVSLLSWPTTFFPLWIVLISGQMSCGILFLFSMFLFMFSADLPRSQQRVQNRAELRGLGLFFL
jgi:hypothetical protein